MTTIWFLILASIGMNSNGGRAYETIPFQDRGACEFALREITKTGGSFDKTSGICVPDRTQQ